jgi:hypothetical protein
MDKKSSEDGNRAANPQEAEEMGETKEIPGWVLRVERTTGVLLLALGLSMALWGLKNRAILVEDFNRLELESLLIAAAGVIAFFGGFSLAVRWVFPMWYVLEVAEMPSLACGLPFMVLGLACFALAVKGFDSESAADMPIYLIMAAAISLSLSLLISLAAGLFHKPRR